MEDNKYLQKVCRPDTINYKMIGKQYLIHNGKKWTKVKVNRDMIGKKFGEFSLTRKMKKNTHKSK